MKHFTSLTAKYMPDLPPDWGYRELISNGLDGETRNQGAGIGKFEMTYSPRSSKLTLVNWGVKIPLSSWLMGASQSRDHDDCIGTFGEGLAMACKCLLQRGKEVSITNRDEKWTIRMEEHPDFPTGDEQERVLCVQTRKVADKFAFFVEIKGVTPEEWDVVQNSFLTLHPDYDPDQTVDDGRGTQRVLLQPCMKGLVFNKGVLLVKRDDLLFGYHLDSIPRTRDRDMIPDYDLRDKMDSVLSGAISAHADVFADTLIDKLFEGSDELELQEWYTNLQYRSSFASEVTERFVARFGADAIAVSDEDDKAQAEALGLRGVILPKTLRAIIESQLGTVQSRQDSLEMTVQDVLDLDQMPWSVGSDVRRARELIQFGLPDWEYEVEVVSFGGDSCAALLKTPGEVQVAEWVARQGIGATLKAILDVNKDHTTSTVMARIIECQARLF